LSLLGSRGCHACENDDSAVRHLPVIEDNELKGIVSIGDLVKHRLDAKELEANVLLDLSRMRA
jgi:CBS domain-containing protein